MQCAHATARSAQADLKDTTDFRVADALNLPFEDNTFDLLWSITTVHTPLARIFEIPVCVSARSRVCMCACVRAHTRVSLTLSLSLSFSLFLAPSLPVDPHFLLTGRARFARSMESGEHMPNKDAWLAECRRVLKPGGRMLMATWTHRSTDSLVNSCV